MEESPTEDSPMGQSPMGIVTWGIPQVESPIWNPSWGFPHEGISPDVDGRRHFENNDVYDSFSDASAQNVEVVTKQFIIKIL